MHVTQNFDAAILPEEIWSLIFHFSCDNKIDEQFLKLALVCKLFRKIVIKKVENECELSFKELGKQVFDFSDEQLKQLAFCPLNTQTAADFLPEMLKIRQWILFQTVGQHPEKGGDYKAPQQVRHLYSEKLCKEFYNDIDFFQEVYKSNNSLSLIPDVYSIEMAKNLVVRNSFRLVTLGYLDKSSVDMQGPSQENLPVLISTKSMHQNLDVAKQYVLLGEIEKSKRHLLQAECFYKSSNKPNSPEEDYMYANAVLELAVALQSGNSEKASKLTYVAYETLNKRTDVDYLVTKLWTKIGCQLATLQDFDKVKEVAKKLEHYAEETKDPVLGHYSYSGCGFLSEAGFLYRASGEILRGEELCTKALEEGKDFQYDGFGLSLDRFP